MRGDLSTYTPDWDSLCRGIEKTGDLWRSYTKVSFRQRIRFAKTGGSGKVQRQLAGQVSSSPQSLNRPAAFNISVPLSDPYQRIHQIQWKEPKSGQIRTLVVAQVAASPREFMTMVTKGTRERIGALEAKGWEAFLVPQKVQDTKVAASFFGRVESVGEDSAAVIMKNETTGESLESRCDLEVLRENGLQQGDEFRCEVVRAKGTATTRITRLPPKEVTKEQVRQVRLEFEERWNF